MVTLNIPLTEAWPHQCHAAALAEQRPLSAGSPQASAVQGVDAAEAFAKSAVPLPQVDDMCMWQYVSPICTDIMRNRMIGTMH